MKKLLIFLFFLFVTLVVVVQYPKLFITKVGEYTSFKIYSNTEIELDNSFRIVLDSVRVNLNSSEFSEEHDVYELYFIKGTIYEGLLKFLGRRNIAFSKFDKHIYAATPDFKTGKLTRNNNQYEWLNLVQIISHEGIHSQMYKDYYESFRMKTPSWINEGYAEYISYTPIRLKDEYTLNSLLFNLENNEGDWLKTEYNSMSPREYLKSRLLITYLIDVKQMNIREIIDNKQLDPDKLYEEIKEYYKQK